MWGKHSVCHIVRKIPFKLELESAEASDFYENRLVILKHSCHILSWSNLNMTLKNMTLKNMTLEKGYSVCINVILAQAIWYHIDGILYIQTLCIMALANSLFANLEVS